jgi:hypothetical protein
MDQLELLRIITEVLEPGETVLIKRGHIQIIRRGVVVANTPEEVNQWLNERLQP